MKFCSVLVALLFVRLACPSIAQVITPMELNDPKLQRLQQRNFRTLVDIGGEIQRYQFLYPFYLSKVLDVDLAKMKEVDQRSIRFDSYNGERKSVEPMAARLALDNVRQTHQSLHHVVADAPWKDENLLEVVRHNALSAMQYRGAIETWIVDDAGLVKKGKHSVGVTRQYCGQVGKQENCRVAVSLSLSTAQASLPMALASLPPRSLGRRPQAAQATRVPEDMGFKRNRKLHWDRSAAPSIVG